MDVEDVIGRGTANVIGSFLSSEFFYGLQQAILSDMYSTAYDGCNKAFNNLFDSLNNNLADAAMSLSQLPENWNANAYSTVLILSKTAFLPVALIFIAVVFSWELVQIVANSNNTMQNIKPETLIWPLLKLALCLLASTNALEIVMLFF